MPKAKKAARKKTIEISEAEKLALLFHNTYETLAPSFGYETRKDTKKFNRRSKNAKLMIAVAEEVIKQTKKPDPKPPAVTQEMFEKYFYKLSNKAFVQITRKWNEDKLKVTIKPQENYDQWLNYFKTMPPNSIRLLAATGMDILPTEAYAALARWHDIISNPARIDKIHQSGLTNPNKDKTKGGIVAMALANDRLGVLKATRDQIAEKLEKGAGARDTAALAREMTEIMTQIADYEKRIGPKKTTKLGMLLDDMSAITKRPSENGKGARHTSFRSRVTIEDVEAKNG
jgi:hypothetical protein